MKIKENEIKYYLGTGLRVAKDIDPSGSREEYKDFYELHYDSHSIGHGNICMRDLIKGETIHGNKIKPLVYPLSMLEEEITHNGETFVPFDMISEKYENLGYDVSMGMILEDSKWVNQMEFLLIEELIELHFDVYGWIEKGLAVDKSKL